MFRQKSSTRQTSANSTRVVSAIFLLNPEHFVLQSFYFFPTALSQHLWKSALWSHVHWEGRSFSQAWQGINWQSSKLKSFVADNKHQIRLRFVHLPCQPPHSKQSKLSSKSRQRLRASITASAPCAPLLHERKHLWRSEDSAQPHKNIPVSCKDSLLCYTFLEPLMDPSPISGLQLESLTNRLFSRARTPYSKFLSLKWTSQPNDITFHHISVLSCCLFFPHGNLHPVPQTFVFFAKARFESRLFQPRPLNVTEIQPGNGRNLTAVSQR